jgi:hypothetical protein
LQAHSLGLQVGHEQEFVAVIGDAAHSAPLRRPPEAPGAASAQAAMVGGRDKKK